MRMSMIIMRRKKTRCVLQIWHLLIFQLFSMLNRELSEAWSAQHMLHAPTEESPRISAIRVMHFSIAPSIPISGRGRKDERKRDGSVERESYGTTTYIAPTKSRYISRVRANPPPAVPQPLPSPSPMRVCACMFACVSIPPFPAARRRHKVRIALAR